MKALRKLLSILLTAVFGLPLFLPLLALAAPGESGVPICCRRDGQHHCMLTMAERAEMASQGEHVNAPKPACPFGSKSMPTVHSGASWMADSKSVFALPVSHTTAVAQMESRWRISRDRSRQKRGPPALASSSLA